MNHPEEASSPEVRRLLSSAPLPGRYVTLEAFQRASHAESLWAHLNADAGSGAGGIAAIFQWLPMPAPRDAQSLGDLLEDLRVRRGFAIFAIVGDKDCLNPHQWQPAQQQQQLQTGEEEEQAAAAAAAAAAVAPRRRQCRRETLGVIGYLDIHPAHRALEVGMVVFSAALQRTCAATEVHYLILRNVLENGNDDDDDKGSYTRIAYKCNALNVASRRAAERLGYRFEGRWRKHMLVEGRPRDSDWLSIIDDDWEGVKKALEEWLEEGNFDGDGRQKRTLEDIRRGM
jgi:RimJ/RimL family protein N-acetyltransferase